MNYRGSYRKLLANSKSAMLAAIEIYNKPLFTYREECFCILLINAWELLAKAILSRKKQHIMYTKREAGVAYRTYSLTDALRKARPYFPKNIHYEPIKANLEHLVEYRDNAVHFYNKRGFEVMIFALAQASLISYKDLLEAMFDQDITKEVTIVLLPLAFKTLPDPIEFMRGETESRSDSIPVARFMKKLLDTSKNLDRQGFDTGRFLTYFDVNLNSVNRKTAADIVVGIDGKLTGTGSRIIVEKNIDPNKKYPFRRKDLLAKIGDRLNEVKFNNFTLDAVIHTYRVKKNEDYYWKALGGGAMQFTPEFIRFLRTLSVTNIERALVEYKSWRRKQREKRKKLGTV